MSAELWGSLEMQCQLPVLLSIAVAMVLLRPYPAWSQMVSSDGRERTEEATGSLSGETGDARDDSSCCGLDGRTGGCGDACCFSFWTATADALFLQQRSPASTVLMFNTQDVTQNLNSSSFDFPFHGGVDVSLARHFGGDSAVEIRYFGVDQWNATATTATTPGSLIRINAAEPIFAFAGTAIDAAATSELHNLEVNALHQFCERLTLLAGFRYAELDEHFSATFVDSAIPFNYDTQTRNRLYGFQVGGKAALWDRGDRFLLEGVGKAGIYANWAAQDSGYPGGLFTLPASDTSTATAFLGEVGATASYRFSEHFSGHCGYRVLWLDGVALATDQVAASDFIFNRGIDPSGDTFFHGAFVGLEYMR